MYKQLRQQKAEKKLAEILDNSDIAEKIEIGIYQYATSLANQKGISESWDNPSFCRLYTGKAMSLCENLNPKMNSHNLYLRDKIINGEIKPELLASMEPTELHPDRWFDTQERLRKFEEALKDNKPKATTSLYTCSRCKKNECTYYEAQTRSADEGMTLFLTCVNCKNKWKM